MAKKQTTTKKPIRAKEHWKDTPDEHDFPAASDYLSLVLDPKTTTAIVEALEQSSIIRRKAKDLLRASELPLLPVDNPHVAQDLIKVERGEHLSPVLVVRGVLPKQVPLVVADGYHRICASYHLDEDADIPCKMAQITW